KGRPSEVATEVCFCEVLTSRILRPLAGVCFFGASRRTDEDSITNRVKREGVEALFGVGRSYLAEGTTGCARDSLPQQLEVNYRHRCALLRITPTTPGLGREAHQPSLAADSTRASVPCPLGPRRTSLPAGRRSAA